MKQNFIMESNTVNRQPVDFASRNRLILSLAWILALTLSTLLISRNLDKPHPQIYMNFDEYVYAARSLALATQGQYSNDLIFPAGFYSQGNRAVGHPMLTGYINALSINIFGFSRASIRLLSLVCFVAVGILLLLLWRRARMDALQGLGIMAIYFLSPWMAFSASTARPGIFSSFLIVCSCMLAYYGSKRFGMNFLLAGLFAGAATFNHPTYFGAACLPFLFLLKSNDKKLSVRDTFQNASAYTFGAILAIGVLFLIVIFPVMDQWREQFLVNILSKGNNLYSQNSGGILEEMIRLKNRFSVFGMPYLNWYIAAVLFCGLLLKWNRFSIIGGIWITAFLCYIAIKSGTYAHYCVQYALGLVLVVMLAGGARFAWVSKFGPFLILLVFILVQIPWNISRVTAQNEFSIQFEKSEQKALSQIEQIPVNRKFTGALEGAYPALKMGHRFFCQGDYAMTPQRKERLYKMMQEQAEFVVLEDGLVKPLKE